jgi:hypothetical protein
MNEDEIRQDSYLFGTPDLSAEEEQAMAAQAAAEAQELESLESFATRQAAMEEAQQATPQPVQGRQQPQSAQPTGQAHNQEQPTSDRNIVQQAFDALAAPGQGVNDWFVDTLNLVPGVNLRKAPKFENDVTQSLREISSIVVPTIFLTKGAGTALGTAASASRVKLFSDPFVKWVAPKMLGAGVGAGVDYAVETSQTDDNLSGTLKRAFPAQFGWIPDDIATLDSDSPDVKRAKTLLRVQVLVSLETLLKVWVSLSKVFVVWFVLHNGCPSQKRQHSGSRRTWRQMYLMTSRKLLQSLLHVAQTLWMNLVSTTSPRMLT